ncbi:RNA polymerase sigma-70 factor, ECF subfamily [Paenibacillus sp. 1_12]|nr:RNA polymerase sigma-70 factor, ECF subfamily [Paenibacillus sp. 1_12]
MILLSGSFVICIGEGKIQLHEKFVDMYDHYFDDVYRFVLFKTGNRWDTDDLVSEIFRKSFEKFDTVTHPNVKPWLMTIARNTVIDFYRKRKEFTYGQDPDVIGYSQTKVLFDEIELRNDCLKQSILTLAPDEREIINMKYIAGLKYKEISTILSKTEQWLKTKSHRIKQKMETFITICMEG